MPPSDWVEPADTPARDSFVPKEKTVGSNDRLRECQWRKASTTSWSLMVGCPTATYVAGGSCKSTSSSSALTDSYPFENNYLYDYPDDGESLEDLDGVNGWACIRYGDPGVGTLWGHALCCKHHD